MEIKTTPTLTLPLTRTIAALTPAWRTGQMLEALVVRGDPARGTALLQLGGEQMEVRSSLPLQTGQRLQLMAEVQPEQLLLRIISNSDAEVSTVTAALRQALPKQAPLAPLFDHLARLLQPPAGEPQRPLPSATRAALTALLSAAPATRQLTMPDGLARALLNSGLFLETRLAQAPEAPATDLKGMLLRLLAQLTTASRAPISTGEPSPPSSNPPAGSAGRATGAASLPDTGLPQLLRSLMRETEGALARLQLHQLRTLPEAGSQEPQWVVELPVRHENGFSNLTLRIRREQESEQGSEQGPGWSVSLELGDSDWGALRAVVGLQAQRISVRFFAERPDTAARIHEHLPSLEQRLRTLGLEVKTVESFAGIPREEPEPVPPLLSERA